MQSLGPNGSNKDLLKQVATFLLQNTFGGYAFDLNQAIPDIEKMIEDLMNEKQEANAPVKNQARNFQPGTYHFQGTITIGGGGGNSTPPPGPAPEPTPTPPPSPSPAGNPDASNPPDRDLHPSKSPFGTRSP